MNYFCLLWQHNGDHSYQMIEVIMGSLPVSESSNMYGTFNWLLKNTALRAKLQGLQPIGLQSRPIGNIWTVGSFFQKNWKPPQRRFWSLFLQSFFLKLCWICPISPRRENSSNATSTKFLVSQSRNSSDNGHKMKKSPAVWLQKANPFCWKVRFFTF